MTFSGNAVSYDSKGMSKNEKYERKVSREMRMKIEDGRKQRKKNEKKDLQPT